MNASTISSAVTALVGMQVREVSVYMRAKPFWWTGVPHFTAKASNIGLCHEDSDGMADGEPNPSHRSE
jgi:hypothetical protein